MIKRTVIQLDPICEHCLNHNKSNAIILKRGDKDLVIQCTECNVEMRIPNWIIDLDFGDKDA